MTKKIIISKDVLENLYINKKLSTHKIAKQFNCDPGVIQRRLREYKIELRQPKKKIIIPRRKLYNLYANKQLSTQKISKILGTSSCFIYYKLKELGITTRKKRKLKISKEKLKKLYVDNRLSCSKIAKKLKFDKITVFNKLKKLRIKTRNLSQAMTIYPKRKFSGNNKLKAYMIGFRLGDLNVKTNIGETIFIKSNTTKKEQIDLIKQVYGKYGHFKVNQGKNDYCIWCNLDKSFSFLLPKEDKIEEWILNYDNYFFSFLAGYSDAEGNFGVYDKRARFRLGSYDKNILKQITDKLNLLGIKANLNLEGKAIIGKHNQDFYRISINEKGSLMNLINFIKPYINHKKRRTDMILAEKNILERNKKYGFRDSIMINKNKFYITTTIPYANAPPHIGFALEIIQADILARWNKLKDKDVFFLTGTDEHGVKNYKMAKEAGLTPQSFVNKNSAYFRELTSALNISNNYFIRTTDKKIHWPGVIHLWNILYKRGDIYKKFYKGYYCYGCERFITEKDLVGEKCPNHPNLEPELIEEENYFFRLSKYSNKIKELIKKNKLKITPEKWKNDFLSLIQEGLTDVSFSRDKEHLPWGIPVPGDEEQVLYVWPDALTNYITGIGYPNKKFKKYWPADVHVVGKDMLRFHAGIWPGMLLSAGLELPKEIIVHGFLTVNGQKMSKSLGNVVNPLELRKKYEPDSIRYYLCRAFPFGQDGDFSEKALISRHNNELADKLGNLVSRVTALAEKFGIQKTENKLIKKLKLKEIEAKFESFELDKALELIFAFVDNCNQYVQKNKLWESKDKKKLCELVESIKVIARLLSPFIPEACEKIARIFSGKKIKKAPVLFKKVK